MVTLLEIRTNDFSGRSYHSTSSVAANETLLDARSPYSHTIYKQFRAEVCSECFHYESGRRGFLTCREYGENAGLSFCDADCRDRWLEREGIQMIDLLTRLESRRLKKKGKATENLRQKITDDEIEDAWRNIKEEEQSPKQIRKWAQLYLDDFEADIARYALMALYHYAREPCYSKGLHISSTSGDVPSSKTNQVLQLGGANWAAFAALQSNEAVQVKVFPELLDNHIRIYRVLKNLFGCAQSTGNTVPDIISLSLVQVMTVYNVRRALGVDPGNSFGIWEIPLMDESECLGFAVYPLPSMFNHHCSPNVRKEREGRRLRFVTTRPIEIGEELCISYGHIANIGLAERQKTLLNGWYFKCMCSRCMTDMANGS